MVFRWLLELVFPSWCELCGVRTALYSPLCPDCVRELPQHSLPYCQVCAEKESGGLLSGCFNCRESVYHFNYIVAAYTLDENMRDLVHTFKYSRGVYMGRFLGSLMRDAFNDPRLAALDLEEWSVCAVPLHKKRESVRYFNQSALLGKALAQDLKVPYGEYLKRVVNTPHQARLNRSEREKNVSKAFTLSKSLLTQKVFLVDDVFTTGATVNACARVLKQAGAEEVVVITLARK